VDAGLIWILIGLAFLGAEMFLPGVWLMWIGLAAVGTGLLLLVASPGFGVAVAVFIALLAAGISIGLRLKPKRGPSHQVNAPHAGLAGRQATVLSIEGNELRVRLGDSNWPARLAGGAAMPDVGGVVRVEAVDGVVLVVRG
jgi:hypothetical protein